jgi:hypothetical protein
VPSVTAKADVQRVAERVDALPLRQGRARGPEGQGRQRPRRRMDEPHQRQVVNGVERQELQWPLRALGGGVDQPVPPRVEGRLAHHVVVGDGQTLGADHEPGADAGLAVLPLEQRADLEQLGTGVLVGAPGGRRRRPSGDLDRSVRRGGQRRQEGEKRQPVHDAATSGRRPAMLARQVHPGKRSAGRGAEVAGPQPPAASGVRNPRTAARTRASTASCVSPRARRARTPTSSEWSPPSTT